MSEQPVGPEASVGAVATDGVLALEVLPDDGGPDLGPLVAERIRGGFEDYGEGPFDERPRALVRAVLRRVGDRREGEVVGSMSWHLVSYGLTLLDGAAAAAPAPADLGDLDERSAAG